MYLNSIHIPGLLFASFCRVLSSCYAVELSPRHIHCPDRKSEDMKWPVALIPCDLSCSIIDGQGVAIRARLTGDC